MLYTYINLPLINNMLFRRLSLPLDPIIITQHIPQQIPRNLPATPKHPTRSIQQCNNLVIGLQLAHILITLIIEVEDSGTRDPEAGGPVELVEACGAVHEAACPALAGHHCAGF